MLEQLIESKNNAKENRTRGGFILTTFLLVAALCFSAVLSSLFAMNLGIGGEDLELSALVMPLAVDNKPEPVEPAPKQEKQSQKVETETTRNANILRLDENPTIVPNEISNVPNTQKARPNAPFKLTNGLEKDASTPQGNSNREQNGEANGIGSPKNESQVAENIEKDDAPVLTKKIVEPRKTTVSGGVVNSQATSLPKPAYSQAAIAVNAKGAVNVQVLIDESGKVVSAKAVSGHPLLRDASEKAARQAKFTPTVLSGQPVKVTGVIIYNFAKN